MLLFYSPLSIIRFTILLQNLTQVALTADGHVAVTVTAKGAYDDLRDLLCKAIAN